MVAKEPVMVRGRSSRGVLRGEKRSGLEWCTHDEGFSTTVWWCDVGYSLMLLLTGAVGLN